MNDSVTDILEEREKQYGDMVVSHARIAEVWSGIINHPVTAHQVALCMAGLKLVRASNAPDHEDSYLDAHGYVEIAETIAGRWSETVRD